MINVALWPAAAFAVAEIEPNNTCATAQAIGTLTPGVLTTITGTDSVATGQPDVDFFKLTGAPGDVLHLTLTGLSDGTDTLQFPLMGIFSSGCALQRFGGIIDPSTLSLAVPADGVVIVAVSSGFDFLFAGTGAYSGTYTLTATENVPIGSISGQIVDAATLLPVTANASLQVSLLRCADPACTNASGNTIAFSGVDGQGRFNFTFDEFGTPIEPGSFIVYVADLLGIYEPTQTAALVVAASQNDDIGNVPLTAIPTIGSVRGRLVDAVTHAPLSGTSEPYAVVSLSGCNSWGCWYANAPTDSAGRFNVTRDSLGRVLAANAPYAMQVSADQYIPSTSLLTPIGVGENRDVGDVLVTSNPIRMSLVQGCAALPVQGGTCHYQVAITNGLATPVTGKAWSTVSAQGLTSFVYYSQFQPSAETIHLAGATKTTRATQVVDVDFAVPASVPTYAFICPTFWFGTDPVNPYLSPQGVLTDYTACVARSATGFTPLTPTQVDALRKEQRDHEAKQGLIGQHP